MKLLIASDLHGSYYYSQKIVEAYTMHQCDKLLLLGDLLYHGPRNDFPKEYSPKKVIPLLNALKDDIIAVRGNCDAQVDQMVLAFPCSKDYEIIDMGAYQIFATHGHLYDPAHMPKLHSGDIFMFGHIHIPMTEKIDDYFIINPGSIAIPKENTKHSYGVLKDKTFYLYDENHVLQKQFTM